MRRRKNCQVLKINVESIDNSPRVWLFNDPRTSRTNAARGAASERGKSEVKPIESRRQLNVIIVSFCCRSSPETLQGLAEISLVFLMPPFKPSRYFSAWQRIFAVAIRAVGPRSQIVRNRQRYSYADEMEDLVSKCYPFYTCLIREE